MSNSCYGLLSQERTPYHRIHGHKHIDDAVLERFSEGTIGTAGCKVYHCSNRVLKNYCNGNCDTKCSSDQQAIRRNGIWTFGTSCNYELCNNSMLKITVFRWAGCFVSIFLSNDEIRIILKNLEICEHSNFLNY